MPVLHPVDAKKRLEMLRRDFQCPHTSRYVQCLSPDCQDCEIQGMAERVGALEDYWKNVAGGNEPC
jgi:hypothetical protein